MTDHGDGAIAVRPRKGRLRVARERVMGTDLSVIGVGGAGKHSCWQPTFGNQTRPTRRAVTRKDGTPLRAIADHRK